MPFKIFGLLLALCTADTAHAQSLIVCEPAARNGKAITSIWPTPVLSKTGNLCFDVRGWPEFSGRNCVRNGGHVAWTGLVIVSMDGVSKGRDSTSFRVNSPVVNDQNVEYVIEWSRGGHWLPMQHVAIDRLSGQAVSYFLSMTGGETYNCHLQHRQL